MTSVIWLLVFLMQSPAQTTKPPRTDARGLLTINQEFYDLAAATGGDFYFWAAGEFASSRLQVPIENEEVVLAYGSVDGRRVFEIPVESGVRSLTIFAGVQRKDLATIVRPDGTVARGAQSGINVQLFQHMIIATIESPAAGTWRLELDGAGIYAVTAHVRPGENGILFSVEEAESCKVRVSGEPRDVKIALFRRDGTLIGTQCSVPDEPFRLGVIGTDDQGRPFQRMDGPLRQPLPRG